MRSRSVLLALAAILVVAAPAWADGTVYRAQGCGDYIFVSTLTGFSVLESSASSGVKDGDELHGNVADIGQPLLFDTTSGRSVFARVAELNLSRTEVTQRIAVRCRAASGEVVVSGYVSRSTGCGNNIFVNAPKGYAILERIAGGEVADGDTLSGPLDRPGRITVEDKQSHSTLVVFVKEVWLSKSAVGRKMAAFCHR